MQNVKHSQRISTKVHSRSQEKFQEHFGNGYWTITRTRTSKYQKENLLRLTN